MNSRRSVFTTYSDIILLFFEMDAVSFPKHQHGFPSYVRIALLPTTHRDPRSGACLFGKRKRIGTPLKERYLALSVTVVHTGAATLWQCSSFPFWAAKRGM